MKASLVVPVYNVAPYARQCLQSIKEQTFKDFECIVIDDQSTDGSYEICVEETSTDARFRLFRQPHGELSAARNYGLSFASGEYVWWIDSDDYLKPDCIEQSLRFMETGSLDMAFFDGEVVNCNTNEEVYRNEVNYHIRKARYGICSGPEMFTSMIAHQDFIYAVFLQCIRRDKIKKLYLDRLPAQDMLYTIQNLLLQERVGHLPLKLYVKRSRDGSAVSTGMTFDKAYGACRTVKALLSWIENESISGKIGIKAMNALEWWMDRMVESMPYRWNALDVKEQKRLKDIPFSDRWLYRQFIGEGGTRKHYGK